MPKKLLKSANLSSSYDR